MSPYLVLSPSYKRATAVRTHEHFGRSEFRYAVHEFEAQQYRDRGHPVAVIPDALRGNIARVRNWMLAYAGSRNLLMVDDNIDRVFMIKTGLGERQKITLTPEDLDFFVQQGFQMCADSGAKLWGLNVAHDPRFYTQNRPFSFTLPVLGTFSGHLPSSLRYDETLPVKEDYDFFLKSLLENRRVLRLNFLMYIADHLKMDGGCQEYRTAELEADNFDRLQQRWGSDIVQRDGSKKGGADFNPILKRPI